MSFNMRVGKPHEFTRVRLLWLFYGYFMVILWLFYGYFMVILWLFYGYFMVILWLFYGYFMPHTTQQDGHQRHN
jgi:predicted membrane protein